MFTKSRIFFIAEVGHEETQKRIVIITTIKEVYCKRITKKNLLEPCDSRTIHVRTTHMVLGVAVLLHPISEFQTDTDRRSLLLLWRGVQRSLTKAL